MNAQKEGGCGASLQKLRVATSLAIEHKAVSKLLQHLFSKVAQHSLL